MDTGDAVVLPDDGNIEFSITCVTGAAARVGRAARGNDLICHGETVADVAGLLLRGLGTNGQGQRATRQLVHVAGGFHVKHPELGLGATHGVDPERVKNRRAVDARPGAEDVVGRGRIARGQRFLEGVRGDEVLAEVDGVLLVVEESGLTLPAVADVKLDARDDTKHFVLNVEQTRTHLGQAVTESRVFAERVERIGRRQDSPCVGVQVAKRRGGGHLLMNLKVPVGRVDERGGVIGQRIVNATRGTVALVFRGQSHPRIVVEPVDARGANDFLGGRGAGAAAWHLVEARLITVLGTGQNLDRTRVAGGRSEVITAGSCLVGARGEVAVVHLHRVALHVVHRDPSVAVFTGCAARDRVALRAHVVVGRVAVARVDLQALKVVAGDDVDHTGNRVRTVNGRGAVQQNLDTLHDRHRDVVQTGERRGHVLGHRVVAQSAAVHQDERVAHSHTAQRHTGRARGERVLEFLVVRSLVVLRQATEQFAHGLGAGTVDLLAVDPHNRRRPLQLHSGDVGTGDDHRGQFAFIILGDRRHGGQRDAQTHKGGGLCGGPHLLGLCSIGTFHNNRIALGFSWLLSFAY